MATVLALVSTTDSQQFSPAITISANARYIFPKYQPNSVVGCSIVIIAASRSRGPEGTERADAGSGTPELGNNAVMICGLLLSHALFEIAMAIAVRTTLTRCGDDGPVVLATASPVAASDTATPLCQADGQARDRRREGSRRAQDLCRICCRAHTAPYPHALNRDSSPAPRGRPWNASTINGHAGRGSGILRNELYARLLIWNRVWMINDPDTARRVLRPHPEGEGHVGDVPELAIVARELFEAASAGRVSMRACSRPSEAAKAYALWTLLRVLC